MANAAQSNVVEMRPANEKRTVHGGSRSKNDETRGRKHLTQKEVHALIKQARKGQRNGARDALMIRMAFEHGLRASELVGLRWQDVLFDEQSLFVRRAKGSRDATHPIQGETLRALRRHHRDMGKPTGGTMFVSERGAPMSVDGFRRMFGRISQQVMGQIWNPHALRHACGYHMINSGQDVRRVQDYLGHVNIQHTFEYTTLSGRRFDSVTF